MHPVLFYFGDLALPSWHIFFVLGTLCGILYLRYLTERFHPELIPFIPSAFISAYIGGLFGARLLSVCIERKNWSLIEFFEFDSLTFYGAFLGASIFLYAWIFLKKLQASVFWDLMMPPLFLGLALGRIGCFLNGDDFGLPIECDAKGQFPWWSVSFPNHSVPIPRYPVQIAESLASLALAFCLAWNFQKISKYKKGVLGSLGLLAYSFIRFYLEYYRGDDRGWWIENTISSSQGISLVLIAILFTYYGLAYLYSYTSKNRRIS